MPIETFDDIIEELMDKLGIYGAHPEDSPDDFRKECPCRCCQTASLVDRIRDALEVERKLTGESGTNGADGGESGQKGIGSPPEAAAAA